MMHTYIFIYICTYVCIIIHIHIYDVLRIEPRALGMLDEHCTTELHLQPFIHLRHGRDKLPRLALNL